MDLETVVSLAQLAAVLIAAVAVMVTLKGIRNQLWLSAFLEFTGRYSQIMKAVPFEARNPHGTFDLDDLPEPERQEVLAAVRSYANLCSEELYLYEHGRIDETTWESWKAGIRDTMRTPCFRRGWGMLRHEYEFYPEFRGMMDTLSEE